MDSDDQKNKNNPINDPTPAVPTIPADETSSEVPVPAPLSPTPASDILTTSSDVNGSPDDQPKTSFQEASTEPRPAAQPAEDNPGKTMGIVSMILSLIGIGLVGLILGVVALNKSKKAGHKNGFALAGIIIGALNIVLGILILLFLFPLFSQIIGVCSDLGAGVHVVDGIKYTCGG